MRAKPSRRRSSQPRARATSTRRRICPEIGQRNGVDAALRHLVDRGDDVGVGCLGVIDVGRHGIDLGAQRLDGADQGAVVLVRIELQADAVALEVELRQHLGNALGGRLLRRHLRLQPDLAQRPAGFWAAGEFSRLRKRCDKVRLDADPPHHLHQAAQTFAGHQHQIVKGRCDDAPDPGLDRRGIRCVVDGEHRALQDVGALLGEQAGELRFLPGFQDQDAVAVQSVSHDSL